MGPEPDLKFSRAANSPCSAPAGGSHPVPTVLRKGGGGTLDCPPCPLPAEMSLGSPYVFDDARAMNRDAGSGLRFKLTRCTCD
ncbi:MAG: hypothetical protein ACK55Z_36485, partial [bacterium]